LGCEKLLLARRGSLSSTWSMPAKLYKNSSLPETNVEELVMEIHRIHPELLERQVRVLVVGCGGTGSAVIAGLPYLHQSLMAHGHPCAFFWAITHRSPSFIPPAIRMVRALNIVRHAAVGITLSFLKV